MSKPQVLTCPCGFFVQFSGNTVKKGGGTMRLQLLIFTITIEKRERKIEEYQYDQYVKQKMDELKDRYLFFNL